MDTRYSLALYVAVLWPPFFRCTFDRWPTFIYVSGPVLLPDTLRRCHKERPSDVSLAPENLLALRPEYIRNWNSHTRHVLCLRKLAGSARDDTSRRVASSRVESPDLGGAWNAGARARFRPRIFGLFERTRLGVSTFRRYSSMPL